MKCKFCERVIDNAGGMSSHEKTCNKNPNKIKLTYKKIKCSFCSKEYTINQIKNHERSCYFNINKKPGIGPGKCLDPLKEIERKQKLREHALKTGLGGYIKGSGRGKKGRYKGYWCDSSWELAWVIYNLDHNIKFERNWKKFPYTYNGKNYNYSPDFRMGDIYIEIKGYETAQTKAKKEQFSGKITTLYEEDMKPYLKYVIEKYGKNYIELYEMK